MGNVIADIVCLPTSRIVEFPAPVVTQNTAVMRMPVGTWDKIYIVPRVYGAVISFCVEAVGIPRVVTLPAFRIVEPAAGVVSQNLAVALLGTIELRRKVYVASVTDGAEEAPGVQTVGVPRVVGLERIHDRSQRPLGDQGLKGVRTGRAALDPGFDSQGLCVFECFGAYQFASTVDPFAVGIPNGVPARNRSCAIAQV